MSILIDLRKKADIPPVFFSKLLNITVYTYIAYEQGKMVPPPEIIKMLSLMYNISESVFYESDSADDNLSEALKEMSKLSRDEKFKLLSFRVLGSNCKPTYKNIKKVKDDLS